MKRFFRKRGSAHFEMIIAFTFFVGFVLFLFLTLEPTADSILFDSVIAGAQDNFEDILDVDLVSVFLKVDYNGSSDCFYLDFPEGLFSVNFSDAGVLVRDLEGGLVDSSFDGTRLSVKSNKEFFRVEISEEFPLATLPGCKGVNSYQLGSVIERDVVSYSKLLEIKDGYFNDYDNLREDLRVPAVFDFAIVSQNLTEIKMIPLSGVPENVNVLAKDKVFEILNSDGSLEIDRMSFRIW
ncbi:MAG: hypothetical protein V1888_03150 [archaeon]